MWTITPVNKVISTLWLLVKVQVSSARNFNHHYGFYLITINRYSLRKRNEAGNQKQPSLFDYLVQFTKIKLHYLVTQMCGNKRLQSCLD